MNMTPRHIDRLNRRAAAAWRLLADLLFGALLGLGGAWLLIAFLDCSIALR